MEKSSPPWRPRNILFVELWLKSVFEGLEVWGLGLGFGFWGLELRVWGLGLEFWWVYWFLKPRGGCHGKCPNLARPQPVFTIRFDSVCGVLVAHACWWCRRSARFPPSTMNVEGYVGSKVAC